jgi:hypothetical protein
MLDDLGETIDCPNCGRPNPSWAQVCRNCGFSLRREIQRSMSRPKQPFPTDQGSLLSIGAAVGSIVLAIVLGLFFSAINPTRPTVGVTSSPTPSAIPSFSPSAAEQATPTPAPTASPTPALPATISFGTGLNAAKQVTGKTDSFGPNSSFAHSVAQATAFGTATLFESVARVADDGSEKVVQDREKVNINPKAKIFGFVVGTNTLLRDWGGGGVFVMRVYKANTLIAQGRFTLSSG